MVTLSLLLWSYAPFGNSLLLLWSYDPYGNSILLLVVMLSPLTVVFGFGIFGQICVICLLLMVTPLLAPPVPMVCYRRGLRSFGSIFSCRWWRGFCFFLAGVKHWDHWYLLAISMFVIIVNNLAKLVDAIEHHTWNYHWPTHWLTGVVGHLP